MPLPVRRNTQIDLLILFMALAGIILPVGIGSLTAEKTVRPRHLSQQLWQEEAIVAQGEKINLRMASAPGLELIEGIGDTLASAIVSNRSRLLKLCNTAIEPEIHERRGREKKKAEDIKRTDHPLSDLKALDSVPGIGLVRSKIILNYLRVCEKP